jgi:hypothetical protein
MNRGLPHPCSENPSPRRIKKWFPQFLAQACAAAGVVGLTFHDLRGTAVTRLALAGCSEMEIATLTGHSLRDVGAILDAHCLNRDPALAESAIRKLEKGTKTPNWSLMFWSENEISVANSIGWGTRIRT